MSNTTKLKNHTFTKPVPATPGQYLFRGLSSTKWRLLDVVGGDVPGDILNVKGTPVEEMHGEWKTINGEAAAPEDQVKAAAPVTEAPKATPDKKEEMVEVPVEKPQRR